jgi:hypothetical protein
VPHDPNVSINEFDNGFLDFYTNNLAEPGDLFDHFAIIHHIVINHTRRSLYTNAANHAAEHTSPDDNSSF